VVVLISAGAAARILAAVVFTLAAVAAVTITNLARFQMYALF
jgi:hypothetical protein